MLTPPPNFSTLLSRPNQSAASHAPLLQLRLSVFTALVRQRPSEAGETVDTRQGAERVGALAGFLFDVQLGALAQGERRERGRDRGAVLHEELGDGEGRDGFGAVGRLFDIGRRGERGGCGAGGGGRVCGGESEEDGMGVARAVRCVGVCAQGESVEHALDVILLDRGEEGFVRGGVVGLGVGDYGGDVGSVDVFGCDEAEALITCGDVGGLLGLLESGFPDHIADAIADQKESFDNVRGEGCGVESQRANLRDMCAEGAVDAAAFNAKHYAQIDGNPFGLGFGIAVGAPAVALVVVADDLKELGRIFFKAVAFGPSVGWAGSDGAVTVYAVCSACIRRRLVMMTGVGGAFPG